MEIIIHRPQESPHTKSVYQVDSFDIEFGGKNTVHVKYKDGSRDTFEGIGYTVSGATTTLEEREHS